MNFNLVEMYNGLLRFNKHILNELAEGLKHLPNLDGVSKRDSLIINEQGNPAWGSAAFISTFENAAYGIEWTYELGNYNADGSNLSTYPAIYRGILNFFGDIWTFIRDVVIINKDKDYNWKRGNDGQDTDKAARVLLLGGGASNSSGAGSGGFYSDWVRSGSDANVGFFTTVKLD